MKDHTFLEARIERWAQAGVLDSAAAERIRAYESATSRQTTLRWPIFLALAFGGLLVAAGVSLFVAAHWDEMSPAQRFSLVLSMVAVFHVGGALAAPRFPALSATFHAIGTAVLGPAIYLAAQIFNLQENWPTGILWWALGAAAAYGFLRHWTQAGFVAVLTPAWLISQWAYSMGDRTGGAGRVPAFGALLLAMCYLSARMGDQEDPIRRTLVWIGGIALFPAAILAVFISREGDFPSPLSARIPITPILELTGWLVALLLPLGVAWLLRGTDAWANVVCALWVLLVIEVAKLNSSPNKLVTAALLYLLFAAGAVGLVAWGVREKRKERVNLGIAGFALTVLFFYFDSFMDKLGRSASLLTLGVLCLVVGWGLERTRRRLLARMEAA